MRIILDADILVYEAATSAEMTVNWNGDLYSTFASLNNAQNKFDDLVDLWVSGAVKAMEMSDAEEEAAEIVFVFSNPDRSLSYRKKLPLIDYKAQRLGMKRPLVCGDLEAWAITTFRGRFEPTLEGDDMAGLLATPFEDVIVTHDKDLLTVPGFVFKPRTQELIVTSDEAAERHLWTQVLTGDRVDGYTGIPNVGPVAAGKILDKIEHEHAGLEYVNYYPGVVAAFAKKGLGEEFVINTVQAARILRPGEYDFDKQEVQLWQPTA